MKFIQINKNIPPLTIFPKTLVGSSIVAYFVALLLVTFLYFEYALPFRLMIFGIISVPLFFGGVNYYSKQWQWLHPKKYAQKLFLLALLIRVIYVLIIYKYNWMVYDTYYESDEGDTTWYVDEANWAMNFLRDGGDGLITSWRNAHVKLADVGYVLYLTILYYLTGGVSDVVFPLLLKAVWGAWTCVLFYHVGARHFGEHVGRLTGIFCALQFNMIWWCGSMMKETEMIFLLALYLNYMDKVLQEKKFRFKEFMIAIIPGLILFTFRAALCIVALVAVFVAILLGKDNGLNVAKKVLVGFCMLIVVGVGVINGDIGDDVNQMRKTLDDKEYQQNDLKAKSKNKRFGNTFATYATRSVFAPLIFTIPFPNMVYTIKTQEMQTMVNGGNYVKNVLSFFVILVLCLLLFSGEWRQHVFPLALLCGYLVALILSVFAHSGRFHMPALPMELMFAAYGISLCNRKKYIHWYKVALCIEVVICVGWAWFKLAGRGFVNG